MPKHLEWEPGDRAEVTLTGTIEHVDKHGISLRLDDRSPFPGPESRSITLYVPRRDVFPVGWLLSAITTVRSADRPSRWYAHPKTP